MQMWAGTSAFVVQANVNSVVCEKVGKREGDTAQ